MVAAALAAALGSDLVLPGDTRRYLNDETETRNFLGSCDAVVVPRSTDEVVEIVKWASANEVPIVPRGGGTGYAGGSVPLGRGIVLSLERMNRVRQFDPLLWRMEVDAGVTTHRVQQLARENGLYYPPDPGAGEDSHIGGNVATNAGGPHAFKYGTTGSWVTGIEAVVPPGDVLRVGGAIRKEVSGFDLKHLLIGSEGTLGVITSVWLRLIPRPQFSRPLVACFGSVGAGVDAIEAIMGTGLHVAALEYVDGRALAAAPARFLAEDGANEMAVLVDVDGDRLGGPLLWDETRGLLRETASTVFAPEDAGGIEEIWRWREGMTGAVTARRGGKVSEDIVVPVDRLGEAIERTKAIGEAHGLETCSWGHAGDGNLHSTFMIDRTSAHERAAAEAASQELFALAIELGGSLSGEHGIGMTKGGQLCKLWPGRGYELHQGIKDVFDRKNLMNPGKKW